MWQEKAKRRRGDEGGTPMGLSTFWLLALLSVVVVAVVISCCHRARLQSIDRLANSDRLKYSTQTHIHTHTLTVIYAMCVYVCTLWMQQKQALVSHSLFVMLFFSIKLMYYSLGSINHINPTALLLLCSFLCYFYPHSEQCSISFW